jgi:hypothetical protein
MGAVLTTGGGIDQSECEQPLSSCVVSPNRLKTRPDGHASQGFYCLLQHADIAISLKPQFSPSTSTDRD